MNSLSRVGRTTRGVLALAERLEKAGAELVSLTESIDTSTAAGKMVFRILAVLAEFERDLCSERTRAALAAKKARGECVGEVPLGYLRNGDRLVKEADGQEALRVIRRFRARGRTFRYIAELLQRRGVRGAKGGTRWDPRTVQRIAAREGFAT